MSSLVRVRSRDFPQLAKLSAGQSVTLTLKGRVGSTTLHEGEKMVELNVTGISTSKNGRLGQAQMLESIQANVSKVLSNVERINTPAP